MDESMLFTRIVRESMNLQPQLGHAHLPNKGCTITKYKATLPASTIQVTLTMNGFLETRITTLVTACKQNQSRLLNLVKVVKRS